MRKKNLILLVFSLFLLTQAASVITYAEDREEGFSGLTDFVDRVIRSAKEDPNQHNQETVVAEQANYGSDIDIESTRREARKVIREFERRAKYSRGRDREDMENMISRLRETYDRLIDEQKELNKIYRSLDQLEEEKSYLINKLNRRY